MKRINSKALLSMSVAFLLAGCGSENAPPEMGAALQGAEGGTPAVVIETTDTGTLEVANDFAFDTARTIEIDFDLESARDTQASVSICTSYMADGDAFDVDYDSCAVRAPMNDGVFSHSMEVTNEFDSVVAVVWFKDSTMAPLHREFTIDPPLAVAGKRGIRAAKNQRRVIVWK